MEIRDSLDVKKAFWFKKWQIPGTPWSICGYSRSAFRTGFYIKELDLMLDAGPQCHNYPAYVLITHTHVDHIASLPFTLIRGIGGGDDPDIPPTHIYGPKPAQRFIENYIDTLFTTNSMIPQSPRDTIDKYYLYHGMEVGDVFKIDTKGAALTVEVFRCDHQVPTISYGISETKQKLKPEYRGLQGIDIAALRKAGTEVTSDVLLKRLAYVCDTTIKAFTYNPSLLEYPVIFIECTFLLPDEVEMASHKKHIHWDELRPYVEMKQDTQFVLFHFSQRYKDAEICEFLQNQNLKNLHWWA